ACAPLGGWLAAVRGRAGELRAAAAEQEEQLRRWEAEVRQQQEARRAEMAAAAAAAPPAAAAAAAPPGVPQLPSEGRPDPLGEQRGAWLAEEAAAEGQLRGRREEAGRAQQRLG
ncbi:hypothetical protein Agub_g4957, partial [Astrephomene gubernaculifera]